MSFKKIRVPLLLALLVVCIVTPVAVATTPAKFWKSQTQDFRVGYLVGFFDAANVSRQVDAHGYINVNFPRIDGIGPYDWEAALRKVYDQPDFADANVVRALAKAAKDLGELHVVLDGEERFRRQWMRSKGGPESLARLEETSRRNKAERIAAGPIAKPVVDEKPKAATAKKAKAERKPATPEDEAKAKLRAIRREKTKQRDQEWLKEARDILREKGMLGPGEE
jgi:hypothetical protein